MAKIILDNLNSVEFDILTSLCLEFNITLSNISIQFRNDLSNYPRSMKIYANKDCYSRVDLTHNKYDYLAFIDFVITKRRSEVRKLIKLFSE